MSKLEVLRTIDFGSRVAEDETDRLIEYFVETDQWQRILNGDIDVIYGPKGSGKSAIYTVLLRREDVLFDRGVVLASAENPKGSPAFKDLATDPPASEAEFVALWKLYIASLIAGILVEYGQREGKARDVVRVLSDSKLIPPPKNRAAWIRSILDYVRRLRVETEMIVDPATGAPIFTGRIIAAEPSAEQAKQGCVSLDGLLATANEALQEAGLTAWLLFDRLDVAFAESHDLERNALRALFRTYLDLTAQNAIVPKIFLRSDIWASITSGGFREASHITRTVTIEWSHASLLNLTLRRLLQSAEVCSLFAVDRGGVLASAEKQESLIKRVFPEQVDTGRNPGTLDWMIGRTSDATGKPAPRELIHLLGEARNQQIALLESGAKEPDGEQLFDRQALRNALPAVSKARLEQTVYAEYPDLKERLEALRDQKATQLPQTLAQIWHVSITEAVRIAGRLVEIGVFKDQSTLTAQRYSIPFLYRPALQVTQGAAEA